MNDKDIPLLESGDMARDNHFVIKRPVYTHPEFDTDYSSLQTKRHWREKAAERLRRFRNTHLTEVGVRRFVVNRLPVIGIMRKYKWRQWLLADVIAGLIIGVMHIPQGMAYAMLVGLEPMYGLYLSFFPPLVYFFLGTSRHNSIGTDAIISLLTGKFLETSLETYPINVSSFNSTDPDLEARMKASRVAGLTLCVGIVQFLMSVFQLGFLTRYLSDPLIAGFTVGAAIHVFTSQLAACFGVKIVKPHGIFEVPKTLYQICLNISKTNIPTFVMTLISLVLLVITKEILNPMVVDKIRIPIPIELILIICGILSAEYLDLHAKYSVGIVGNITQGIPPPAVPDLSVMSSFVPDIFITVFISFSINVALANIFTEKHGYSIQSNQEYLAFGTMNIFGSFFWCYPASPSLSRSAVQEAVGGKTQLTSLIAAILILFVLYFIGHFFYDLPVCILAAFILVALKSMFMKLIELKELWIFSFWDFGTWVVTFLTTVILDIDYGLILGVLLAILTIMLRTQSPRSHILGQVAGTDIYKNIDAYHLCKEIEGIKIFRYEGSLYYASSHHFRKSLYRKVLCDPKKLLTKVKKVEGRLHVAEKEIKKGRLESPEEANALLDRNRCLQEALKVLKSPTLHHIVIDCSTWGYTDYVGVKTLFQVINECKSVNISVLLANPTNDIRKVIARSYKAIDDQIMYLTVHDAVIASLVNQKAEAEAQLKIRRRMKYQRMVQRWYLQNESRSTPSLANLNYASSVSSGTSFRRKRRPHGLPK